MIPVETDNSSDLVTVTDCHPTSLNCHKCDVCGGGWGGGGRLGEGGGGGE